MSRAATAARHDPNEAARQRAYALIRQNLDVLDSPEHWEQFCNEDPEPAEQVAREIVEAINRVERWS